jgi:hypothetical protein
MHWRNSYKILVGKLMGGDKLGDQELDERIILKRITEKEYV